MNSPRFSYLLPRPDVSHERNALASIYARAVQRYQEAIAMKKAAHPGGPDDVKESSEHVATSDHTR
jgi:hypothetical protein